MKKGYKFLALMMALVMVMGLFASCSQPKEPLSTVGDREVSWEEFEYYVQSAISNVIVNLSSDAQTVTYETLKAQKIGDLTFDEFIKKNALQNCLDNRYIEIKYDELGLEFGKEQEAEVDAMTNELISQYGGAIQFNEMLKQINTSKETFKEIGIISYKQSKICETLFGDGGEQEITEEDWKSYFEENYTLVQQIVISTRDASGTALTDETLLQAQKELANSVLQSAQTVGADFPKLMEENSADVDSSGNVLYPDGYLFNRSESYVQEFIDLAFSLKIGEIDMTESTYGYHILKRLDHMAVEDSYLSVEDAVKASVQADRLAEVLKPIGESAEVMTDEDALNAFTITRVS